MLQRMLDKPNELSNELKDLHERLQDEQEVTVLKALALLLDRGLSRADWEELCKCVNSTRRILPPYHHLVKEKLNCRPPGIMVEENNVQVSLQALLEHTVSRILDDPDVKELIQWLKEKYGLTHLDLLFIFKYGLDGSKGHPIFKQFMSCSRDQGALLATHMVGLQIVTVINGKVHILYNNSLCNSALSCRPVRYWFVNEDKGILDSYF